MAARCRTGRSRVAMEAYIFDIDQKTGLITVADRGRLDPGTYSLTLMASDGILPSHDQTVTITVHR